MSVAQSAIAVENVGLKGDMHAIPDSIRQILLIEKETLNALHLSPGAVKENITTQGIELMKLQRGQKLRVGNEVVLEVTRSCSPCRRMEEIRRGLLQELAGRRGMLVKVICGGEIHVGDVIEVVSSS